jgi:hypothetical protein
MLEPRATAALVAASVWLAGCGDDGELSRAEYTKRATAICADAQRELRALGDPGEAVGLVSFARRTAGVVERQAEALRDLRPPRDLAPRVDRALAVLDRLRASLLELARVARSRKAGRIQRVLVETKAIDDEGDVLMRRLGLPECAG